MFKLTCKKKSNYLGDPPTPFEITPDMKGIKHIHYCMGEEINFQHSQIDLSGQPIAVISYCSEGADSIYIYKNNRWEVIGCKKIIK